MNDGRLLPSPETSISTVDEIELTPGDGGLSGKFLTGFVIASPVYAS